MRIREVIPARYTPILGIAIALAAILLWFSGGSTQAGSAVRGSPSGELSSVSPQLADPVVVFPAVAPPTVVGGTEFAVEIKADDVQDLAGAQATLTYDPALLTFMSVQQALGAGCADASNGGTPGVLSLAVACTSGHSGAPLTIWKAVFKAALVTQPTPTTLTIQDDDLVLGDASANEIPAVGASTTIVIIPGICGDQNGDGKVNILDAIIDMQIIVGIIRPTPQQLFLSDINRNGRIDVGDVVLTLQHIVGLFRITACGTAIEIDHFPNSSAVITLIKPDGSEETIALSGPTTVHVFFEGNAEGTADDDDGDGLDDSATQIVGMKLTGDSSMGPVVVTLNPAMPSKGEIEETANTQDGRLDLPPFAPAGTADSFFDVFFEVRVGDMPPLHNGQPKRMASLIDHKPPSVGTGYENPEIIPLLRPDGQPSGFAIGKASHIPRPVPALDHFKCYNTEGQPEGVGVALKDQFGSDRVLVGEPVLFCNPVAKAHDNRVTLISDPNAHLTFYAIATETPRPQVIRNVLVRNQFGEQKLEVDGPIFLAVPTQKLPHALPRNLDHFECYKSAGQSVNAVVDLRDQFHEEPDTKVLSPVMLCNPVAKLHGDIVTPVRNPQDHLVCYDIVGQPFQTRVETRNQFGPAALPVFDPRWLCAPSRKVVVNTIEIDHFPLSTASIVLSGPEGEETVPLSGPTTVHVFFDGATEGSADDSDGDGLDEVSTQIVQLHLTGNSSMGPVVVTLNPDMPSMGEIEETANTQDGRLDLPPFAPAGTATSFFDVFFQIHVAGMVLHNAEPKRMASLIDHKPPSVGTGYENPNVIPLLDENGRPIGMFIGPARHIPDPTEVDHFEQTSALVGIQIVDGPFVNMVLSGPATVHVDLASLGDPDGNGREQLNTELVHMTLTDVLGSGATLRAGSALGLSPSRGQIEEQDNFQNGRLDLPGPHPPLCTPPTPGDCVGAQADSFFDVFFEIELADGTRLRNTEPLRIVSVIDKKPPEATYRHVITQPSGILLVNAEGEVVAFLVTANHSTRPVEIDHFENTSALVGIETPDGELINMVLRGPATVHVDLRSLHDSPANGREEVSTELAEMTLTDVLGSGATLRAGSGHGLPPSKGKIEENANIQNGRLDLPGPDAPFCSPADVAADCAGTTADSFFDVFFEIDVPGVGTLHNEEPLRVQAVIDEKPPVTTYRHVITQPIVLHDANGQPTGFRLVTAEHSTRPGLDHFKCYTIAEPQQPINAGIELRDQFGTSNARVLDPFLFCNPAVKLHSDRVTQIEDPNAHLKFYKIATAVEPRTRRVLVSNQFGEQVLNVIQPAFLAVPTQKFPHGKPRNLDHFECYVVRGQPVGQFVSLRDQFHLEPEVGVGSPFLLCNPAVKFHAGAVTPVRNREDHLVCYDIKGGPFQKTVRTRNQFGFEILTTLDPRVFCVPSKKKVIAVEVDHFPQTTALMQLQGGPLGPAPVPFVLHGPAEAHVFFEGSAEGDANDDDGNGRDEVDTELVMLNLTGGGVTLRVRDVTKHPFMRSLGQIEEDVNNTPGLLDLDPFAPGDAISFFDVLFEIELPDGTIVHNDVPLRVASRISEKPPRTTYVHIIPPAGPIELMDENDEPTGVRIVSAQHITFPVEVDHFPESQANIVLIDPNGNEQSIALRGPTTVHVFFDGATEGSANDSDGDGRDDVVTQIVQLDLKGESPMGPVHVRLRADMPSMGGIAEQVNNTPGVLDVPPFGEGLADSFFDVFFEVEITTLSGDLQVTRRFHTDKPKRMASVIDHKPPRPGTGYENPDRIPLLDENGKESGLFIGPARHVPVPPPVEVDPFPNAQAQITIAFGTFSETIALTGYTEVHVFFEGATEGTANDDDRDQMDEVNAELVSLDMRGFSQSFGEVVVRAGRMLGLPPTMGQIEETANNAPGVLELPPFTRDGRAFSFFDVFFELQAGGGDFIGRNDKALPMTAVIRNKPPAPGDEYRMPASVAVEVVDSRTGQRMLVTSASHMPRPPAVIVDIIGVDSCSDGRTLEMHINFSDITDMSQVVGFIHLDTDQDPTTGRHPNTLFGTEAQDIGFDFYLDLFGLAAGVVNLWTADDQLVGTFDALVDGPMVWLFIPLDALGQDDGNVDITMVLGDFIGPTDWAPDAGHGTAKVVAAGCPTIIEDPEGDNLVNGEVPVPQGGTPSGTPEAWKQ